MSIHVPNSRFAQKPFPEPAAKPDTVWMSELAMRVFSSTDGIEPQICLRPISRSTKNLKVSVMLIPQIGPGDSENRLPAPH
jgi:hypothetical protein